MKKVYGIIYKTTCLVNGKIYIGQTTDLENKNYLGSGTNILRAINKYGKENFIRETLIECYNQIELDEWEYLYIWEYNSRNKNIGYNIAKGAVLGAIGDMSHTKLPEVRAKMSASAKGKTFSAETRAKISENHADMSGENHPMYGKTHSAETRAKMSEAHKGKTISEETREKLKEARKGKKPNLGKTPSEETMAKLRKAAKSIPVLQYDVKGNIIAEYYGSKEAERQTGIFATSIIACCKGKVKSAGGYIWIYK